MGRKQEVPQTGNNLNRIRVFGYYIGSRFISNSTKEGWVPIPRCAWSTLKRNALTNDAYTFLDTIYEYDKDLKFTIIIRDPWKRYISGLLQGLYKDNWLWHRNKRGPKFPERAFYPSPFPQHLKLEFIYESLFETGFYGKRFVPHPYTKIAKKFPLILDEHTVPFSVMIAPFIRNEVEFIDTDENLTEELEKRLGLSKIMTLNVTKEKYAFYNEFVEYFEPKLKANKEWMQAWNEVYAEDIWIYENRKIRPCIEFKEFLSGKDPKQCGSYLNIYKGLT